MNALLADGSYTVRAVTRNISSDAAQSLKSKGAQLVKADFTDLDSLKKAVEGSEFVFGV